MAYLRWSGSDWYVYASCNGRLQVISRFADESSNYDIETVKAFLSGDRVLADIPGWRETARSERRELLWAMREYVAAEGNGEDIESIGHNPLDPNLRKILRDSIPNDRDSTAFRAKLPPDTDGER